MDPEKTIDNLDELRGLINQRVSNLGWEIETIQEQWAGMSRVGGQRADHAAILLGSLRFHLDDLSKFSAAVSTQITELLADPFQRNE